MYSYHIAQYARTNGDSEKCLAILQEFYGDYGKFILQNGHIQLISKMKLSKESINDLGVFCFGIRATLDTLANS